MPRPGTLVKAGRIGIQTPYVSQLEICAICGTVDYQVRMLRQFGQWVDQRCWDEPDRQRARRYRRRGD